MVSNGLLSFFNLGLTSLINAHNLLLQFTPDKEYENLRSKQMFYYSSQFTGKHVF